jgi:hypothetical protein
MAWPLRIEGGEVRGKAISGRLQSSEAPASRKIDSGSEIIDIAATFPMNATGTAIQ